jgi:nitrate/nitrite transporter NarK
VTSTSISPRAWLVWGVGVSVYFVAVFNRTSLGVAGLLANHRFGISAAQLSFFTMLQLIVYAGMQIPVGLMVDRFGSRRVLMTGAVIMTVAQTGFALATTYPEALLARTFVGAGDAMTFISVLRLVGRWFPLRRVALVTQLTGNVGQLGAIVAAIPLSWMLTHLGWTPAYLGAALAGPITLLGAVLFLRDTPESRNLRGQTLSMRALGANLKASWSQPGTRLGFWVHFSTPFSSTVLGLLWGYPFFVKAEHVSSGAAGTLLTALTFVGILSGPIMGYLAGRGLPRRSASLAPLHHGAVGGHQHRGGVDGRAALARACAAVAVVRPGPGGRLRRPGLDDRLRRGPDQQPLAPAGECQRHHQRRRLRGGVGDGGGDRLHPRLAHAQRRRLHQRRLPLGDVVPVPRLGARHRDDPATAPLRPHPSGTRGGRRGQQHGASGSLTAWCPSNPASVPVE